MKNGLQTTEFGVTAGGVIASLLVTFGIINVSQADQVAKAITDVATGMTALFVIWHLVTSYVQSRTELKKLNLGTAPTEIPTVAVDPAV